MQQLQGGVLSPDVDGAFMISGLSYCSEGVASYKPAVDHAEDPLEDPLLSVFLPEKRAA